MKIKRTYEVEGVPQREILERKTKEGTTLYRRISRFVNWDGTLVPGVPFRPCWQYKEQTTRYGVWVTVLGEDDVTTLEKEYTNIKK